jgi:uncharacterized radical SAM superfamily Fe-S cluster-containing enzyme
LVRPVDKAKVKVKQDADYIFHELTRSICPECKTVIDAQILIKDNKVLMRKRCPEHGWFTGIISSDAQMYVDSVKFNKPGTLPLETSTEVKGGCPLDCGLCPEHKQHMCLALIEVNTACNLNCPICFANAGVGFSLTMEQVEFMLDRFVETEGDPEVIQFSGGEPTIHPDLMDMIQAAKDRGIRQVMVNTNGVRIARDDKFLDELAEQNPVIYFQFDGLRPETYITIRGEDLLDLKLKALDRLAEKGIDAVLVAAIEHGVNTDKVGAILKFGLEHPAVRGVVFQPVTHVGRHIDFDPIERVTIPDVIHGIVDQRWPVHHGRLRPRALLISHLSGKLVRFRGWRQDRAVAPDAGHRPVSGLHHQPGPAQTHQFQGCAGCVGEALVSLSRAWHRGYRQPVRVRLRARLGSWL